MGGECVFDATMHAVCQYSEAQLCEKQSDCPAPLACASDYRCRNLCADDADCNVLGINGRVCARDANGVNYCAVPSEVSGGSIVALPPLNFIPEEGGPGVPDGAVVMGLDAGGASHASDASDASDATIGATPTEAGPGSGPMADGGPLGFVPTNFSLTVSIDGGTDSGGAPDVKVSSTCTNCLGSPPMTIQMNDGTPADLYVLNSLEIDPTASLTLTGPHPVIVAVLTTVSINGLLSVAASGGTAGPGGFAPGYAGPGAGVAGFGGGYPSSNGGGGSYCGAGGSGGASSGVAAPGGPTYGTASLQPFIGGSAGGAGAYGDSGGAGGGAIQIVAGTSITVGLLGAINAGGGGVSVSAGGSGGAILLESPTVLIDGNIAANGGGGSYGDPSGANGAASSQPALGAYPGGNGSAGTSVTGSNGQVDDAGSNPGAGGGGAGRIRINTISGEAAIAGTLSPSLATPCATQGNVE